MVAGNLAAQSADQIYRAGPETLTSRSNQILSGRVSSYEKTNVQESEPGPNGFPLVWTVTGRIEAPTAIKGASEGPVRFNRTEYSPMFQGDRPGEPWESEYGVIEPEAMVLLFVEGERPHRKTTVLPGTGPEHDLAALVRDIVAIQSIADPGRQLEAWSSYALTGRTDDARRSAIRSLVHSGAPWANLGPVFERLVQPMQSSSAIRAFTFGIVAFAVMEGKFAGHEDSAVTLLCRHFETEPQPNVALQNVLALKLLLRFASEQDKREKRGAWRREIFDALSRRAARGLSPELRQQYEQINATWPGELR